MWIWTLPQLYLDPGKWWRRLGETGQDGNAKARRILCQPYTRRFLYVKISVCKQSDVESAWIWTLSHLPRDPGKSWRPLGATGQDGSAKDRRILSQPYTRRFLYVNISVYKQSDVESV